MFQAWPDYISIDHTKDVINTSLAQSGKISHGRYGHLFKSSMKMFAPMRDTGDLWLLYPPAGRTVLDTTNIDGWIEKVRSTLGVRT